MVDNNDNFFCNNGVRLANITFKIQTESGRKWVSIAIDFEPLPPEFQMGLFYGGVRGPLFKALRQLRLRGLSYGTS